MKSLIRFNSKKIYIGIVMAVLLYLLLAPLVVYMNYRKSVFKDISEVQKTAIGIVLGAGVTPNGEPRDMLQDRLDLAADMYTDGVIDKILLTGDNREENYNEPAAMFNYLVDKREVPEIDIVLDYAGRRTYDSCARANEIFELDNAILISQGYHLPRSIFLCDHLGVSATGISATLHNKYDGEMFFKLREFFAIHKAIWDVYVVSPSYVGGDVIDIWSD